jgi:hypothetical protein
MKRRFVVLSLFMIVFFSLVKGVQSENFIKGFSIKFTGGYGNMAIGDLNAVLEGQENLFNFYTSEAGVAKEGEFKELNRGFEYECEFIIDIAEHFGLGIGVGYIQREQPNEFTIEMGEFNEYSYTSSSLNPKLSVIPIRLTLYYFFPIAARFNLFLNGGIGYYFGKINYSVRDEVQMGDWRWVHLEVIEAQDNGLGFHGGIGFEFSVTKSLAFFMEGAGRYAKFKDWEGGETLTSNGNVDITAGRLWHYGIPYGNDGRKYYSWLDIQKEKPNDPDLRNVRKAEGDYSGISFRFGLKIKF